MKGDWFKAFKCAHNMEFSEKDFKEWSGMVDGLLPTFKKYLPEGSRILECCCGMGCTAIPLSKHYKVTAFDKDERILEFTRKNAKKFGGDIQVVNADFRKIDEIFGADIFDACTSGGVLEHFPVNEVRELVDKQLTVAPLVFIDVPLGDGKETTDAFNITRYDYGEDQWLKKILKNYHVVEHKTFKTHPKIAGGLPAGDELMMVVKRE